MEELTVQQALVEAERSTAALAEVVARLAQRERELREAKDQLELLRIDTKHTTATVQELERLLQSKAYRVARRLGDARGRILP